jgi:phosphoenolpyruvate synthase/pyruvate phosphate dikinase
MGNFAKSLHEISGDDVNDVGRKAASLGDLARAGFNIPAGYCISRSAYYYLKEYNRLQPKINELLSEMNYQDLGSVEKNTSAIRNLVTTSKFPPDLKNELSKVIGNLSEHGQRFLAVRASFAPGTHHSSLRSGVTGPFCFLRGKQAVIQHTKICWSSYWSSKATLNRCSRKVDHNQECVAPIIQRMVESRVSGILYTWNYENASENEIRIEANWGLGDTVVSGRSMNDLFILRRPGLALKKKHIVKKTVVTVFDEKRGTGSTEKAVDSDMMDRDALMDAEFRALGEVGLKIEKLFGSPQEIDWAFEDQELFILGSRDIQ